MAETRVRIPVAVLETPRVYGAFLVTWHKARHSAASYLIEAGLNAVELMKMIAHTDPRTTKMIYGKLFPDSNKKVAAKLNAYLDASDGAG